MWSGCYSSFAYPSQTRGTICFMKRQMKITPNHIYIQSAFMTVTCAPACTYHPYQVDVSIHTHPDAVSCRKAFILITVTAKCVVMLPAIMHNSTQKEQAGWYSGPHFKWTYCMNIVVCVRTYVCMYVCMYGWMDGCIDALFLFSQTSHSKAAYRTLSHVSYARVILNFTNIFRHHINL